MNLILNKILKAKEKRSLLRKEFTAQNKASLSFNLNIVGYPKTNIIITKFFKVILDELKIFLIANRIFIDTNSEIIKIDEAGNFFICTINNCKLANSEIKNLTEKFETKHELGRLIDVDITDKNGNYISSHKQKLCFFCKEKPAIVCMREKTHNYSELRSFLIKKIEGYLNNKKKEFIIVELSNIALKSILYEVSLSPKPGLVDFYDSGSHKDMDYYTFLNSSSSFTNYFQKFAKLGYDFKGDLKNALPLIRQFGLQAEKAMFTSTNNINTQKGVIFLMGISLFSASYIFSNNNNFNVSYFINVVKNICKNLVKEELQNIETYKSHGEICFKKYGLKGGGARFEVEQGFPTVINYGLPILEKYLKKNKKEVIDFALKKTLLSIISQNNDSNVLYRKGESILEKLKFLANDASINNDKYKDVCNFCLQENISPGGSADLLAITIFIYFVKKIKNEF